MKERVEHLSSFTPCRCGGNDIIRDLHGFTFNLSRMAADIQKSPDKYIRHKIDLSFYCNSVSGTGKEGKTSRALYPIILLEIKPDHYEMLCGYYKAVQALQNGISELEAVFVTSKQHVRFMTSENAYKSFIRYWNTAVDEIDDISRNTEMLYRYALDRMILEELKKEILL